MCLWELIASNSCLTDTLSAASSPQINQKSGFPKNHPLTQSVLKEKKTAEKEMAPI